MRRDAKTGKKRIEIEVRGVEFPSARGAIGHALAAGGKAVRWEGRHLVVGETEAERMEAAGVYFAYLGVHNGRVVTVPVNG